MSPVDLLTPLFDSIYRVIVEFYVYSWIGAAVVGLVAWVARGPRR